jgi:tetratricopeptide (TPR) repeat protein
MMPLARAEAEQALQLYPFEPMAHTMLGLVADLYEYNRKEADGHFQRALAVNPISPEVRGRCACYYLIHRGRFQEAIDEMYVALEQDPLSVLLRCYMFACFHAAGMQERALVEIQKALEMDENYWVAHMDMVLVLSSLGRFADAVTWADNAYRLAPWLSFLGGLLAGICSRAGNEKRAKEIMDGLPSTGMPHTGMALYHVLRLEIDAAADWYEKAIEQHEVFAVMFSWSAIIDPLRCSARWPKLARMMNLAETA